MTHSDFAFAEAIKAIVAHSGEAILRNESQTIAMFSDLAPQLKRERELLKQFYKCDGCNLLLAARKMTDSQRISQREKVVKMLIEDYWVADSAAYYVCDQFWYAISGEKTANQNSPFLKVSHIETPSKQHWGKNHNSIQYKDNNPLESTFETNQLPVESTFITPVATASSPLLRYDGLYECPSDGYSYFIRFFSDSVVVSVSSTGNAEQVADWLNHDYNNRGKYVVVGSHISFSCTSNEGTVDYEGTLTATGMDLNTHSHINDRRSSVKYHFVPSPGRTQTSVVPSTVQPRDIPSSTNANNGHKVTKRKKWPFRFGF